MQERNRQTSCRVVSVFCGYRRGSCRLFYLARYPTTYDSEIGFGTTLSFFIYAAGVRVAEKSNVFMEKEKKVYSDDRGGQTIIVNQSERKRSNGLGTAGFVLALLGLIFSWVPGLGWVLWLLGLIFSFVGISSSARFGDCRTGNVVYCADYFNCCGRGDRLAHCRHIVLENRPLL